MEDPQREPLSDGVRAASAAASSTQIAASMVLASSLIDSGVAAAEQGVEMGKRQATSGGGGGFAYALLLGSAVWLVITDGEGLKGAAGFAILVGISYIVLSLVRAAREDKPPASL